MQQHPGLIKKGTDGLGEAYYGNFQGGFATANTAKAIGTLFATPFIVPVPGKVDRLGFDVQATAVGAVARLGLYNMKAGDFYPGELIIDGGEQDAAGAVGFKSTAADFYLDQGIYWWVYTAGVLAPTVRCVAAADVNPLFLGMTTALAQRTEISVARAYAALPSTFPAGAAYGTATPILGLYRMSRT